LKQLQDAHVPVLWRPYHEMNGDWFWWGGRHGEYSTRALYRQIFDRLVKHHKLNNLIWLWSVDRVHRPEMEYSHYYPGNDYLDILSLDIYGSDFNKAYYDSLVALSKGKPLVLGEVGNPPSLEVIAEQPKWALWVVWAGMVRNTTKQQYAVYDHAPNVLFLEDSTYWQVMAPYRKACGLLPLPVKEKGAAKFAGEWLFNEAKSILDNFGAGNTPYKMEITQNNKQLMIKRSIIVEWGDDRVTVDTLALDGRSSRSEFMNSPRITTTKWAGEGDTLVIESKITFDRGGNTIEMVSTEHWSLQENGTLLAIKQVSTGFRGKRELTMIYEKR
jgi:hypothetical protein